LFGLFGDRSSLQAPKGAVYGSGDGKEADRQRVIVKLWAAMAEWDLSDIQSTGAPAAAAAAAAAGWGKKAGRVVSKSR
jgi:hypothetical protein